MSDTTEPIHFENQRALRTWFSKNHSKETSLWILIHKPMFGIDGIKRQDIIDEALSFGWCFARLKSIDIHSYKMKCVRRNAKSSWGATTLERYKELEKLGRIRAPGKLAFKNRDRSRTHDGEVDFTPQQLALLKRNKKAWAFLQDQRPSYLNYVKSWINSAKREETKAKRLSLLLEDSEKGSELRFLVQLKEKSKPTWEPGRTPIEVATNIGPVLGSELRSIGIETVERLKETGWERASERLLQLHPHRARLIVVEALVGAVEDCHRRELDAELKAQARQFFESIQD